MSAKKWPKKKIPVAGNVYKQQKANMVLISEITSIVPYFHLSCIDLEI